MNSLTYNLPFSAGLIMHTADDYAGDSSDSLGSQDLPTLLRDAIDRREFNQADAMAASGDYFITLATRLDLLAQSMPRDSSEQIELENLVNTLFYLQKHYTVIANHKLHNSIKSKFKR